MFRIVELIASFLITILIIMCFWEVKELKTLKKKELAIFLLIGTIISFLILELITHFNLMTLILLIGSIGALIAFL